MYIHIYRERDIHVDERYSYTILNTWGGGCPACGTPFGRATTTNNNNNNNNNIL